MVWEHLNRYFSVILVNNFEICCGAAFTKRANINPSAWLTEFVTDKLTDLLGMNHTRIYSLQGCGDWVYNHFLSTKLQRWRWWTPKASSIPSWFFLWKGGRQKHLAIFQITEFQMKPDTSYIKTSFNVNQNCSACTAHIFFIKCPRLKSHCSLRNDILRGN